MKIAILNIYNGRVQRGSEVFVSELASQLCKSIDVTVFQSGDKTSSSFKVIQITGVPFMNYQTVSINKPFILRFVSEQLYHIGVLLFTLKCLKHLLSGKYDWVIPINGRYQVLLCRLYRSFSGCKVLISGHAGIGKEDKINIWFGKPDVFVALTQKALTWAQFIAPHIPSTYIPNGVNIHEFKTSNIKPIIKLNRPIILCVSALLSYKRIHLLIQAVEKLKNVSLLIIGGGELKEEIQKMGDFVLKNRFLLIPHVSHNKLVEYYSIADVFSLPSEESEAFGLVYLEAMATNIPVVAPNDENREKIIGNGGLCCDVTNIDEYANTLQKVLKSDLGNKPRKQAERFSWEKIALQYQNVFDTFTP